MNYNYGIDLLEKEINLIEKSISDLRAWENYPEALKDRMKKIKQMKLLIDLYNNN